MGEGRVGTLRSMLNWRAIDPTKADDDYQWGNFDNTVAAAARGKIEILPFVYGTPNWVARGIDGRHCGNCEQFAPRRGPARAAFASFVGAAVDRYGRGGEFWAEHPRLPREPITRLADLERAELEDLLPAGPDREGLREAARRRRRGDPLPRSPCRRRARRHGRARGLAQGDDRLLIPRRALSPHGRAQGLRRRRRAPLRRQGGVGQAAGRADQRRQSRRPAIPASACG